MKEKIAKYTELSVKQVIFIMITFLMSSCGSYIGLQSPRYFDTATSSLLNYGKTDKINSYNVINYRGTANENEIISLYVGDSTLIGISVEKYIELDNEETKGKDYYFIDVFESQNDDMFNEFVDNRNKKVKEIWKDLQ